MNLNTTVALGFASAISSGLAPISTEISDQSAHLQTLEDKDDGSNKNELIDKVKKVTSASKKGRIQLRHREVKNVSNY
jgi:hypothetical protein